MSLDDSTTKPDPGWRIGLVGPLPPPPGGIANQTRQLASLLVEEGIDVDVVRMNAPYRPAWIERIRGVRALFRLLPYLASLWKAAGRVTVFHVFANSGWAWHLFTAPAVWMGRLRGIPVIVNYRGGGAEEFFRRSWWLVRPTLALAALVSVPSGFLADVFKKRGVATTVVPNIVDLSRFTPDLAQPRLLELRQPGWPHVVVTRNLEQIYDIGTALGAFARIRERYPNARLLIVGSGPEQDALQALAGKLAVAGAITFTGRIDNAELPELYRRADLMLNPSLVDNMPISILEALASGVPVVTTDVGGIPYLVKPEQTALLVKPGDEQAMADAALRVLEDKSLRQRLVSAGLQEALKYQWPVVRECLLGVYSRVLDQERR